MMAYAPPAPIRIFVVMEDMERAVARVITKERVIISQAPNNPAFPTTHPRRRYIITPRMVKIEGVNTPPNVPKPVGLGGITLLEDDSEERDVMDEKR